MGTIEFIKTTPRMGEIPEGEGVAMLPFSKSPSLGNLIQRMARFLGNQPAQSMCIG
jgi:hypothetical protein